MAIVALVLWMFTAGAGFYLLATSNLGRVHSHTASAAQPAAAATGHQVPVSSVAVTPAGGALSRREMKRAIRDRWDPPSLTAAKQAPILPGLRSLLEFAHPACGLIGLGFWLGFTLVHNRTLGWIAFGLVAATACLGLSWFTANVRAARAGGGDRPAPHFAGRLLVLHGGAAAVTIALAVLAAFVIWS